MTVTRNKYYSFFFFICLTHYFCPITSFQPNNPILHFHQAAYGKILYVEVM